MTEHGSSRKIREVVSSKGDDKRRIAELEDRIRTLETALHVANGKLQMALEMGKLSSWERNHETDRMTGTATFMATLGLPPDAELTYEELERIYHPADVERV